jgi:hypothetical protein
VVSDGEPAYRKAATMSEPPTETQRPPAPPEPPTEVHEPAAGGSDPKRKAALSAPVVIVLAVAGIAWGIPILQGFHFGCNVLAGDEIRETRLGLQMCRSRTQGEVNEAREKAQQQAQQEREAQANREAGEKRAENEKVAQREHEAQQQREAERPGLEAAASKLGGEAAALRTKEKHEEALMKSDEHEAEALEAKASHVESEEPAEGGGGKDEAGSKIREQASASREHAAGHSSQADTFRGEAEPKESEAEADRKKASEG